MSFTAPASHDDHRAALLSRLRPLRTPDGVTGTRAFPDAGEAKVFGYCVYTRERLCALRLDDPAIVVVLSGTKEVWRGDRCERLPAGTPFVMPAGVTLDVVNIPDERTGRYESLCISIDAGLRRAAASLAAAPLPAASDSAVIPLSPDLVEAYGHAAAALADPRHAAALARHRVLEILLLVRHTPAAAHIFAASFAERVARVVAQSPGRDWRVEDLAAEFGVGASTLRRRLTAEGRSFRSLVLAARMQAAESLLADPSFTVAQAAQAAGYSSRSHFARRFRDAHGAPPSRARSSR